MGEIPQDGTNDQVKPIKALLKSLNVSCTVKTGGKRLQSMDLSAATDRLPVQLQSQILTLMGFDGELWRSILEREWFINLDDKPQLVRYAVGQPMGAYSSFACLALTHHVIVRIAALRVGVDPKKLLYAVLGDDGAMAHEKVAKSYRNIFSLLGMDINPIKGFDGTVLEFAKQLWTLNGYNLSPLGAKNILLFIRNVEFLPSILYELLVKNFPLFVNGPKVLPLEGSGYSSKRNYKRCVEGMTALPLVTVKSLEKLISSLFFQKRVKVDGKFKTVSRETLTGDQKDFSYLRVRLRVLMSIGPRSGLWYLDRSVYSYIIGSFFDGY